VRHPSCSGVTTTENHTRDGLWLCICDDSITMRTGGLRCMDFSVLQAPALIATQSSDQLARLFFFPALNLWKRSRPTARYPYHTWFCQAVCAFVGLTACMTVSRVSYAFNVALSHPFWRSPSAHHVDYRPWLGPVQDISCLCQSRNYFLSSRLFVPILLQQST
jgi:hypothetical protein